MIDFMSGFVYAIASSVLCRAMLRRANSSPPSRRLAWFGAACVIVFGLLVGMALLRDWSEATDPSRRFVFNNGIIAGIALGAFVVWPLFARARRQR